MREVSTLGEAASDVLPARRMPQGAVYVGRPTKWGNPFKVGTWTDVDGGQQAVYNAARATRLFREYFGCYTKDLETIRGRDLVCWCPLDQPCHADVLLEWANREVQG